LIAQQTAGAAEDYEVSSDRQLLTAVLAHLPGCESVQPVDKRGVGGPLMITFSNEDAASPTASHASSGSRHGGASIASDSDAESRHEMDLDVAAQQQTAVSGAAEPAPAGQHISMPSASSQLTRGSKRAVMEFEGGHEDEVASVGSPARDGSEKAACSRSAVTSSSAKRVRCQSGYFVSAASSASIGQLPQSPQQSAAATYASKVSRPGKITVRRTAQPAVSGSGSYMQVPASSCTSHNSM
jgi:hypothetical protein